MFVPIGANAVYKGMASIDLRDFTVRFARRLTIGNDLASVTGSNPLLDPNRGAREMICLPDERCYVVNVLRLPRRERALAPRGVSVEVWEVSPASPPVLRRAARLLSERLRDLPVAAVEGQFISPSISTIRWVPPLGFVINVDRDSIYLFDARTSRLSLAFHPGVDTMRLCVSTRGDVAVSMPGTRQAFVFTGA
jgi:hypothetical protein